MSGDLDYPRLFETVPDALVVVDGTGTIVAANGHAERLFGYEAGGLLALPIEALMPEGARDRHQQHRAGYMARPRVRAMGDSGQALVGLRRDGQWFPVEIALTPLRDAAGSRFLASIRDVSETQRARQGLARARYDAVMARIGQLALEARDDGAVVADVPALLADALEIQSVAVAFLRPDRAGLDIRAAHGFTREELDAFAESDEPIEWQSLASRLPIVQNDPGDGHEPSGFPSPARLVGSGALVPLLDRDRPMGALVALADRPRRFDHDALHLLGSVANMLAAMMQRRRTEEQLAHSQRLDAIGQLTGGIAHDFNNLLTIISGNLQLIQDESPQGAAWELAASALRSVSRGADLTAKLLAFARRQQLMPKAVAVESALRDVETMLRRTLGEAVHIRVHCVPDLPAAYADPTQLDTALVNLALNARDAMPRGGELTLGAEDVELAAWETQDAPPPGRYVMFTVRDTGRGMTRETLARALEPFFTTKEAGRGSGLGLSMVYGFARQSGGHLRIDSRLGYGTRVELLLPVAADVAAADAAVAREVRRGRGEVILVVEDESEVRAIANAFLGTLGYRTREADSAESALDLLRSDLAIDLLFSDIMLGEGIGGRELACIARELRPSMPVLLTSGYNESTGQGEELFSVLRKPYGREQLAMAVAGLLPSRT